MSPSQMILVKLYERTALSALLLLLVGVVSLSHAQDSKKGSMLLGQVRDAHGAPVVGAKLHLMRRGATQALTVESDSKGEYDYASVDIGEYTIRAEKFGFRDASFGPFMLREGQSTRIELQFKAQEQNSAGGADGPQFFDPPQFTVAGVTDAMNHGGHGSDAVSRTTQSLTHDLSTLNSKAVAARPPEVEGALREVVKNDPANFEATLRLGTLLAAAGKSAEAIPFLERANQLRQSPDTARELASAYLAVGKLPKAQVTAEAGLAHRESADLHHLLADVAENQHEPLRAVREYQRAAEIDPSEANLFDWGAELLTHRTLQPAVEVFTRGHERYPQSARMLVGLGVAWYASGSFEQAAKYVGQAADLNPANSTAYVVLGKMTLAEAASTPAVVDHLEKFVNRCPTDPLANYYYAVALWKQGRTSQSAETARQVESLLEKASQLDPKLAGASLQLGIVYEEIGNLSRAVEAYQSAVSADPNLRDAHYRLAQLYRRAGKKAQAEQELAAYNRISREILDQNEREAHEIPQFVYTLRNSKSSVSPQ